VSRFALLWSTFFPQPYFFISGLILFRSQVCNLLHQGESEDIIQYFGIRDIKLAKNDRRIKSTLYCSHICFPYGKVSEKLKQAEISGVPQTLF